MKTCHCSSSPLQILPFLQLALASLLVALSTSAQAERYTIVDLGVINPEAVNIDGDVAGQGGDRHSRATVWRKDRLDNLAKPRSDATAINGHGDVAGHVDWAPTIWPRREPARPIDMPDGAGSGTAMGIAPDGTVAGWFSVGPKDFAQKHCFIADPQGVATDIGQMGSGDECIARAMNGAHQVVGFSAITTGTYHAFLWEQGQFFDLGVLPGDLWSYGLGVNKAGHVVGASTGNTSTRATLWRDGLVIDLGGDPRYLNSRASGISDKGVIVGFGEAATNHAWHAVRFAHGKMIDLASEVDDLADWRLEEATAVNREGVIVGLGARGTGARGFKLIPIRDR